MQKKNCKSFTKFNIFKMKIKNLNLTIIFVSYFSDVKVKKIIKKLDSNFKIIVVENSNNRELEKNVVKFNKNVKFYFPKVNNGFGAGLNYGLKRIKTNYILYLDLDTEITSSQIIKVYKKAKTTKSFGVITAKIKGQNYHNLILENNLTNGMKSVSYNTGCLMMFNKKIFKKVGYFDENFFLYFEENDFYERCKKNKKKIFLFEKITISHQGSGSIEKNLSLKYNELRNWHYCWSKFNYYLKHRGIFSAYSKTFPNLIKSIKGILKNSIIMNKKNLNLSYAELSGLISAYIRLSSYFRIH